MYSLVEFQNGERTVAKTKSIRFTKNTCTVNFKGVRYEAKLVLKCDNKQCLLEILPTSPQSIRQLVPLLDRNETKKYLIGKHAIDNTPFFNSNAIYINVNGVQTLVKKLYGHDSPKSANSFSTAATVPICPPSKKPHISINKYKQISFKNNLFPSAPRSKTPPTNKRDLLNKTEVPELPEYCPLNSFSSSATCEENFLEKDSFDNFSSHLTSEKDTLHNFSSPSTLPASQHPSSNKYVLPIQTELSKQCSLHNSSSSSTSVESNSLSSNVEEHSGHGSAKSSNSSSATTVQVSLAPKKLPVSVNKNTQRLFENNSGHFPSSTSHYVFPVQAKVSKLPERDSAKNFSLSSTSEQGPLNNFSSTSAESPITSSYEYGLQIQDEVSEVPEHGPLINVLSLLTSEKGSLDNFSTHSTCERRSLNNFPPPSTLLEASNKSDLPIQTELSKKFSLHNSSSSSTSVESDSLPSNVEEHSGHNSAKSSNSSSATTVQVSLAPKKLPVSVNKSTQRLFENNSGHFPSSTSKYVFPVQAEVSKLPERDSSKNFSLSSTSEQGPLNNFSSSSTSAESPITSSYEYGLPIQGEVSKVPEQGPLCNVLPLLKSQESSSNTFSPPSTSRRGSLHNCLSSLTSTKTKALQNKYVSSISSHNSLPEYIPDTITGKKLNSAEKPCENSAHTLDNSLENKTLNSTYTVTEISTSINCSEYIPDTTIDATDDNINSSKLSSVAGQNASIEIIEHPLKLPNVKVPHKSSQTKQHFCIFCKTLKTKLPRHFILMHKCEKRVKDALCFPINSKERLEIFEELRKKGNFLHNTSEEYNTGILIVSRQQQAKHKNIAEDYICCKNCKGFFSKKTLRIHMRRCGTERNSRQNLAIGRSLTQYIHPAANYTLRTKVFPVLRDDEIVREIRYDELVIKWANLMTEKYLPHQYDMIRARLRLISRFIIEIKKLDNGIRELRDIYKPNLFDKCVQALRKVAQWDDTMMWFKTPFNAKSLTSLIKKCGARLRSEYIKMGLEDLRQQLANFLLLWEEEVQVSINKKASDDQCNRKRDKKEKIPLTSDIKKLNSFLKNKIKESLDGLQNNFDLHFWNELVNTTLIHILIFNRRRPGELERIQINSYINKDDITDNIGKELFQNMSKQAQLYAKQFSHLSMRGKLGRTVSVILDPLSEKAIQTILKYRVEAGIPKENDYIFSCNTTSVFSKPYIRACPLLREYAQNCRADFPETLRATFLRKHIATYISLMNDVEDSEVDQLANFMGHNKDIHKNVYRIPVPIAEVTRVSKLLMSAIGEDDAAAYEEDDDDVDDDDTDDDSNGDLEPHLAEKRSRSSKRKRRSDSPASKTKRVKWSEEERRAIAITFGALEKLEKLPTTKQCSEAINIHQVLKRRTPEQVKSWIDNQRRYKLKV